MEVMQKKNTGVIIMKFLATFLITWSHFDIFFPAQYKAVATGGAIGDALFFFCSGFTLFLGRNDDFMNWYKRRISRVYPAVIMWAVLSSVFFAWEWSALEIISHKKYWFISSIMVYYVIIYIIRQIGLSRLNVVFYTLFLFIVAIGFLCFDLGKITMYGGTYFMRFYYFLFMLLGSMTAVEKTNNDVSLLNRIMLVFASVIAYYGILYCSNTGLIYREFQIVSLIPMFLLIKNMYYFSNSEVVSKLLGIKYLGWFIYAISSLTLEIYLVQFAFLADKYNNIWPMNIIIVFVVIILMAYVLKCFSNLFSQVFDKAEFSWRAVFIIK